MSYTTALAATGVHIIEHTAQGYDTIKNRRLCGGYNASSEWHQNHDAQRAIAALPNKNTIAQLAFLKDRGFTICQRCANTFNRNRKATP